MTMRNPEINEIREEFAGRGLEGWLWPWLHGRLCAFVQARLAPRYRAGIYSPSGKWDAGGIGDLVNEFIIERGITKRVIQRGLLRAQDAHSLLAYLEESLMRYAVSKRRRTVASNIFVRLREVLASDPELQRVGNGGRELYGPLRFDGSPRQLESTELSNAARYLPSHVEWVEYETGERLSPGISSNDLARIARSIIEGTQRFVSASQLMELIRNRFGLSDETEFVSLFAAADSLPIAGSNPLEDAVALDIARSGLAILDARQKAVLREWLSTSPAPTVREIGVRLGLSKSLIGRVQHEISAVYRGLHIQSPDEGLQVLKATASLLRA